MSSRAAGDASPAPLPAREAYRLWAPSYDTESAFTTLEDRVVRSLTPPLGNRSLLDAACGTGRRLPRGTGAPARAVGVDLVPEMLMAGHPRRVGGLVAGDVLALPFGHAAFDVVWCRLALGHVGDLPRAYRELARVTRPGGCLIISDFHAAALAAGHTRTFRDGEGRLHVVESLGYERTDHEQAAASSGWVVEETREEAAGAEERPFYERAGRTDQFDRDRELRLLLAMRFACR